MIKQGNWVDHHHWNCPNHLGGLRLPANVATCYYVNCKTSRPGMEVRPEYVEPEPPPAPIRPANAPTPCAYHLCNETARPGSKYCSRRCSNRNARYLYRKRKRDAA